MKEYIDITNVGPKEIEDYLKRGWEVIETTKSFSPPEDTFLTYHIGYPAKKKIEDLQALIYEFEKRGLTQKLFEKIATENKEDLSKIQSDSSGYGFGEKTETGIFMSNYDYLVRGQKVDYYK